jgi:hypothetical protein
MEFTSVMGSTQTVFTLPARGFLFLTGEKIALILAVNFVVLMNG